jgi:dTDP-L-rhamnose 4-epimerase
MASDHVLITGGAGFIGSHLADVLLVRGFEVTVLDCLLPQVHARSELDDDGWPLYLNPQARRIRGSLLDAGVFKYALRGITHLVHLAASVGVGQSMTDIFSYTHNNTMAAALMLDVLSRGGHTVRCMTVASSMSVYGEGEYRGADNHRLYAPPLRTHEQLERRLWEITIAGQQLEPVPTTEEKRLQPASIYAINKRDHEEMFLTVGRALNIPTTALRLFNAYGSRQSLSNPYTGVAAIFISRLLNNQPPLVFEDGRQMRDFVHVLDVAEAFASVLEAEKPDWEVFNVASSQAVSIADIAVLLARLLGKNIAPKILQKHRIGDIRHCFANTSKIEQALAIRPERDLEQGMLELIEWVRRMKRPADRCELGLAELEDRRMIV